MRVYFWNLSEYGIVTIPCGQGYRRLGWVLATLCAFVAVFGQSHMSWPGCIYHPEQQALYTMLAPVLWSLFIAWTILASHYGYGGECRWFFIVSGVEGVVSGSLPPFISLRHNSLGEGINNSDALWEEGNNREHM